MQRTAFGTVVALCLAAAGVAAKAPSPSLAATGFYLETSGPVQTNPNPPQVGGQWVFHINLDSPIPPDHGGASTLIYVQGTCVDAAGVQVFNKTVDAMSPIGGSPNSYWGIFDVPDGQTTSPEWQAEGYHDATCDFYLFVASARKPGRTNSNTLAALFNVAVGGL